MPIKWLAWDLILSKVLNKCFIPTPAPLFIQACNPYLETLGSQKHFRIEDFHIHNPPAGSEAVHYKLNIINYLPWYIWIHGICLNSWKKMSINDFRSVSTGLLSNKCWKLLKNICFQSSLDLRTVTKGFWTWVTIIVKDITSPPGIKNRFSSCFPLCLTHSRNSIILSGD